MQLKAHAAGLCRAMQKLNMHEGARRPGQITVNVREGARKGRALGVIQDALRAGATVQGHVWLSSDGAQCNRA
jgi:hypothetical protein